MEQMKPIKVLIADDESIVRKGLMATVDWARYNMTVVADVPNGARGWEAFLQHRPEVIITDIVMPEMDGIALAERIKAESPHAKILLLSCHRDFEYAQQGIRIGASGYLLKTAFEDSELDYFLRKFQAELEADPEPQPESDAAGWEAAFYAWLSGFDCGFRAELERRWHAWQLRLPCTVYAAKAEEAANPWSGLEARLPQPCAALPCGAGRRYYTVGAETGERMERILNDEKQRYTSLHWHRLGPLQGLDEWLEALVKLHRESELERRYGLQPHTWPETISEAVRLVAGDLSEPWSASDVARRVGLSRSHFSMLFKKTVGESFLSFLYRMRLDAAMDLLSSTDLTLQDIAERIGMIDGKYVSKWFKRCCGVTPSQYRSEQKGESRKSS
ncbi:response regulator [Paenibacillus thiaminolyticus]|uniref:response regulator transcription factor n=1 Tax=Paenibacillus thiaminolyticus TaxID=49283 RepID=UPI0035A670F8